MPPTFRLGLPALNNLTKTVPHSLTLRYQLPSLLLPSVLQQPNTEFLAYRVHSVTAAAERLWSVQTPCWM